MKTIFIFICLVMVFGNDFTRIQISKGLDFTSNIVHPNRSY